MRLKKEVSNFSTSCEHLIAETEMRSRTLTEEETLLIEYYCREVLKKVVKRPPPRQEKDPAEGGQHHPNDPPSDLRSEQSAPP
jgi:hypothetical protein